VVCRQEIGRRVFDTCSYDDPSNSELKGELIITLTSDAFIRELDRLDLDIPQNLRENSKLTMFRFRTYHRLINPQFF
jgi:hypothetical protein